LNTWLIKRIGPSELGSIRPTSTGLGNGLVPISDELFKALLKLIDVDEHARLVGSAS